MNNKKLILLAIIAAFWVGAATAHEGGPNCVVHMVGNSGPIIGTKTCGSYSVWYQDDNADGVVDRCTGVFLAHDKFHTFPVRMILNPDINGKPEIGCSCEPVITEGGGDS